MKPVGPVGFTEEDEVLLAWASLSKLRYKEEVAPPMRQTNFSLYILGKGMDFN